LALDPADGTLWLRNGSGYLEQYSQAGVLLSTGPYVGSAEGGEFNLAPTATPEPETLVMFGSGIIGLAGVLRRKINL
jgi:PEP-CTERM motif